MITSSFDKSRPLITPSSFYKKSNFKCPTCIITYSNKIIDYVKKTFECKTARPLPIYVFEYHGRTFASYLSKMGAAQAAMDMLAANQIVGAENFVVFGSAGSLDSSKTSDVYIVPTEAYRDEGLSYHYAKPSDYMEIKNAKKTASFFSSQGLPFTEGRVWTTDAVFMETENKVAARKADGCLAVDMELSGLQAVCDFHNLNLFSFFVTGDVLSTCGYSKTGLADANHNLNNFDLALLLADFVSSVN